MKISQVALLMASVSSFASAARSIKNNGIKKNLLSKARRLDENDDAEEEEYAFLTNYKLKFMSCKAGETVVNAENGEYEYSAVVFRLCPAADDGCDDEKACSSGYGDYVVGLNTFVNMYMEDQAENMNYDDNFRVDEYAECREYENENDDDGNGVVYYIGPACTEDGDDIKLDFFYDEGCTSTPEDVTFEDVSNGWELPYSEGGLISTYCQSCQAYDEDNGGYELKEMCQRLYEDASGKCETEMEYYHYYGKQEGACDYIAELLPASSSGGAAWFLGIVLIAALGSYVYWWKQKKAANNAAAKGELMG